jgi:hypothetical protein
MGNEALEDHAMDLGNWVEMLQGSYLCTSENVSHQEN